MQTGFVFCIFVALGLVFHCKNRTIVSEYVSQPVLAVHPSGGQFVGSASCVACHSDISLNHRKTAHFNSSAVADLNTMKGSFEDGGNLLELNYVKFAMERVGDSFYQHTTLKNRTLEVPAAKFDLVLGSGVRGQTYASWQGDKLFQLQPSYHSGIDGWINSPGYPDYYLERPIRDQCLRCHVTYAEVKDNSADGNQYFKENLILGIDCERCHRPAATHVNQQLKKPNAKISDDIMTMDTLTRQQRLDLCAQCHSGTLAIIKNGGAFSYLAGEALEEYLVPAKVTASDLPDVHGNQYGLLTSSECFKQSNDMDCVTCHDPHVNQRSDITYFNQKCVGCHDTGSVVCTVNDQKAALMGNNCISCHMPLLPSKTMTAQLKNDSIETAFYIRTHLIGVYTD